MPFKKKVRLEHHHIVLSRYQSDYVVCLAEKHNSNISHEIGVCILFRMFNDGVS